MKRWTLPVVGLVVVLIGGSGYLGSRQARGEEAGAVQAPATVSVTRGDVQQVVSAPGHLVGTHQVTLAMQAPSLEGGGLTGRRPAGWLSPATGK